MTKHPHAESMALYAQDAAVTDKPWDRWEYCSDGRNWVELISHPSWSKNKYYRRKQKTININGFEVPEPYRGKMKIGQMYWIISIWNGTNYHKWDGVEFDLQAMKNGLIHLTEEAAKKHVEALFSFTKQEN